MPDERVREMNRARVVEELRTTFIREIWAFQLISLALWLGYWSCRASSLFRLRPQSKLANVNRSRSRCTER